MLEINQRPKDDSSDSERETHDMQLLLGNGIECSSNEAVSNIIARCDHLRRLIFALKLYEAGMRDSEWEGLLSIYGSRMLSDFAHLLSDHGSAESIEGMMGELHECACSSPCAFSSRHFKREQQRNSGIRQQFAATQGARSLLYRDEFDALHLHLRHLFEFGFRASTTNNDNNNNAAAKCDAECSRSVNKFSVSSVTNAIVGFDAHSTFMDRIFAFISKRQLDASRVRAFVVDQHYDSEALNLDLSNVITNPNLIRHADDKVLAAAMREYIALVKDSARTFATGLIFFYWPNYHPEKGLSDPRYMVDSYGPRENSNAYSGYAVSDLYIDGPRWSTLKEEAIESGHCTLHAFSNIVVFKTEEYLKTDRIRQTRTHGKASYFHYGFDDVNEVHEESRIPISAEHVQSLVLYTDFTALCTAFSATFRPRFLGESLQAIKERNRSFYFMSKLLRETVECFGTKIDVSGWDYGVFRSRTRRFYFGMDRQFVVPEYLIRLCGPTSTSTMPGVAARFANTRGTVIELASLINDLCCFDCSFVSAYKEEAEHLFIGGAYRIRIASIAVYKIPKYQKFDFELFHVFDDMLSGSEIESKPNVTRRGAEILRRLIKHAIGDSTAATEQEGADVDPYLCDCFKAFTQNKREIVIDYGETPNPRPSRREDDDGGLKDTPSHLRELIVPFWVDFDPNLEHFHNQLYTSADDAPSTPNSESSSQWVRVGSYKWVRDDGAGPNIDDQKTEVVPSPIRRNGHNDQDVSLLNLATVTEPPSKFATHDSILKELICAEMKQNYNKELEELCSDPAEGGMASVLERVMDYIHHRSDAKDTGRAVRFYGQEQSVVLHIAEHIQAIERTKKLNDIYHFHYHFHRRPNPVQLEEIGIVPQGYFTDNTGTYDHSAQYAVHMERKHRRLSMEKQAHFMERIHFVEARQTRNLQLQMHGSKRLCALCRRNKAHDKPRSGERVCAHQMMRYTPHNFSYNPTATDRDVDDSASFSALQIGQIVIAQMDILESELAGQRYYVQIVDKSETSIRVHPMGAPGEDYDKDISRDEMKRIAPVTQANIPTSELLRLFPNLQRLTIRGANRAPFPISSFVSRFSEKVLSQHEHIELIRVEGIVADEGAELGRFASKDMFSKEQAQRQYRDQFKMSFAIEPRKRRQTSRTMNIVRVSASQCECGPDDYNEFTPTQLVHDEWYKATVYHKHHSKCHVPEMFAPSVDAGPAYSAVVSTLSVGLNDMDISGIKRDMRKCLLDCNCCDL